MFSRTLLAISLSTLMIGSAYAQSLVEQPLTVQTPNQPLEPINKTVTPASTEATATQTVEKMEKKTSFFKKKEKKADAVPTTTPTEATAKMEELNPNASLNIQPLEDIKIEPTPVEEPKIKEPQVKDATKEPKEPAKGTKDSKKTVKIPVVPPVDAEKPPVEKPVVDKPKSDVVVQSLSLHTLNNAEWSSNLSGLALKAFTAKAQVLLDNAHTTPGAIDGQAGNKMSKAIRAFQIIHNLNKSNSMNQETWNKLVELQGNTPAFMEYTITANDVNKNLYVSGIPESYEEKSKMAGLKYTRTTEMLGEKFHLDESFLRELNPNAKFVAGEKIIVPNVHGNLPEDISVIIAMKEMKQVYLFNSKNQMVGSFPATVGKETSPSPSGTLKVTRIAKNPWYTKPGEKTSLPAGPNTPVGNVWIALSKPSYGIHGTPEPSKISNDGQGSAGCVRLTNWDANRLATAVKPGVTVIFRDDSIKR